MRLAIKFGFLSIGGCLLMATQAVAACSSPSGSEGNLRYSKVDKQIYFCDGVNWVSPGGGETTVNISSLSGWDPIGPPQVGSNGGEEVSLCQGLIGTPCGGGIFAGDGNLVLSPAGCKPGVATCTGVDGADQRRALYASQNTTSSPSPNYPNPTSYEKRLWSDVHGRYGWRLTQKLKATITEYTAWGAPAPISPAHKWCADLNYAGKTDWYMPTMDEMQTISDNMREIIDNAPPEYRFRTNTTDLATDTGCCNGYLAGDLVARAETHYYNMKNASHNGVTINTTMYIRCVRRD
jgi:hypothetical protein